MHSAGSYYWHSHRVSIKVINGVTFNSSISLFPILTKSKSSRFSRIFKAHSPSSKLNNNCEFVQHKFQNENNVRVSAKCVQFQSNWHLCVSVLCIDLFILLFVFSHAHTVIAISLQNENSVRFSITFTTIPY